MHGREVPREARSEEKGFRSGSVGIARHCADADVRCRSSPRPSCTGRGLGLLLPRWPGERGAPVLGLPAARDGRALARRRGARRADRRRRGARRDPRRSPPAVVATESWFANPAQAAELLAPRRGGRRGRQRLPPVRPRSFDLVASRHPVTTPWDEIARVLARGGGFLSQQVGVGLEPGAHRLHDGAAAALRGAQRRPPPRERGGAAGLELTVAGDEVAARRLPRRGRRRVLPAQGAVDGPGLLGLALPPSPVGDAHQQIEREGEFRVRIPHRFPHRGVPARDP